MRFAGIRKRCEPKKVMTCINCVVAWVTNWLKYSKTAKSRFSFFNKNVRLTIHATTMNDAMKVVNMIIISNDKRAALATILLNLYFTRLIIPQVIKKSTPKIK